MMPPIHRLAGGLIGLLATLAPTITVAAQSALVARAHGTAGHDLHVVDLATGQLAVVADGLTFLPTGLVGTPLSEQLRVDRPRGLTGPAPSVRLPSLGSLFRVQHSAQTALLHVRPDGSATLRAERLDAGAPALLDGIAISPASDAALIATDLAAGGDVLWLDLASDAPAVDLTAALPPLAVAPGSLRVHTDTAWFVADGVLHVVDLVAATPPVAISIPLAAGEVLVPELATSADGLSVALVTESTPERRRLFVAHASGVVTALSAAPVPLSTPSYDQPGGPLLALSSDGSCVAWRQLVLAQELFVQRLDVPVAPVQVTADGAYIDTIDNVAILGFIGPAILVFAAGEIVDPLEPGQVIGAADFYLQNMDTGTTANVTQTSGVASPPFTQKGALEVLGATQDPSAGRLLIEVDPDGGDFALLGVPLDGAPGLADLLPNLLEPPVLTPVGDSLLVSSLRETLAGGALRELHLLPPVGRPQLLASLPESIVLDRFAPDRSGASVAFVASAGPGFELLVRLDLGPLGLHVVWPQILAVSPALGFSADGQLLAGLGATGGPYVFGRFPAPSVGALLGVPKGDGFPLNP